MNEREPEILEAHDAQRLLQRAAELQAAALRQADANEDEATAIHRSNAYRLDQVRSAAVDVGISGTYVDAAWVDMQAERVLPPSKWAGMARRFFGRLLDAITVRRTVRASAPDVLSTIEAIFPKEPFNLTLRDQRGDPSRGGVLIFDVHAPRHGSRGSLAADVGALAIRQVHVTVRPIEGGTAACEVTLRGPLAHAHHVGLTHGLIASATGGGVGAALALTVGVVLASPGALVATPLGIGLGIAMGLGGAAGGSAAGRQAYRRYIDGGMARARSALEGLLGAVVTRAERAWAPRSGRPIEQVPASTARPATRDSHSDA